MARALRIGQLAKITSVATKTIRYYEAVGVLPSTTRTAAGYRQYDRRSVQRLLFIRRARALGLPLHRLKALMVTLDTEPGASLRPRLLALVRGQLTAVRHRIRELERLQQQLQRVGRRLLKPSRPNHSAGCRCQQGPEDCPCLEIERVPVRWVGQQLRRG